MKRLTWYEPGAIVQEKRRLSGERRGPMLYAIVSAVVSAVFAVLVLTFPLLHNKPMTGSPGGDLGLLAGVVGVGLFVGPMFYFINEVFGGDVLMNKDGVTTTRWQWTVITSRVWKWADIAGCGLARVEIGGKTFSALVIRGKDGGAYAIGMRARKAEQVRQRFADAGRPLETVEGRGTVAELLGGSTEITIQ